MIACRILVFSELHSLHREDQVESYGLRMRQRHLSQTVAITLSLVLLSGCSELLPKDPIPYSLPPAPTVPDPVVDDQLPLSSFIEKDHIRDYTVKSALHASFTKCLARKGYRYFPQPKFTEENHRVDLSKLLNVLGPNKTLKFLPQHLKKRQYPPGTELEIKGQTYYRRNFSYGTRGHTLDYVSYVTGRTKKIPFTLCERDGYLAIYGSEAGVLQNQKLVDHRLHLTRTLADRLQSSSTVTEVLPAWQQCMSAKGHTVQNPWDKNFEAWGDEEEAQFSDDTVACKAKVKFDEKTLPERSRVEREILAANTDLVNETSESRAEFVNRSREAMGWSDD